MRIEGMKRDTKTRPNNGYTYMFSINTLDALRVAVCHRAKVCLNGGDCTDHLCVFVCIQSIEVICSIAKCVSYSTNSKKKPKITS